MLKRPSRHTAEDFISGKSGSPLKSKPDNLWDALLVEALSHDQGREDLVDAMAVAAKIDLNKKNRKHKGQSN